MKPQTIISLLVTVIMLTNCQSKQNDKDVVPNMPLLSLPYVYKWDTVQSKLVPIDVFSDSVNYLRVYIPNGAIFLDPSINKDSFETEMRKSINHQP